MAFDTLRACGSNLFMNTHNAELYNASPFWTSTVINMSFQEVTLLVNCSFMSILLHIYIQLIKCLVYGILAQNLNSGMEIQF